MMNIDWQTGVVLACVALAVAALLRPVFQRWRASTDQASNSPAAGDSAAARSGACGSCRGCSSGGCH